MASKTFASAIDPSVIEATSFFVEGRRLSYDDSGEAVWGEPWKEGPFRCLPEIPAIALDRLASSIGTNTRGETTYNAPSVVGFLRAVLIPPDRAKLDTLLDDDSRPVTLEHLAEIMGWVTEELGTRPSGR